MKVLLLAVVITLAQHGYARVSQTPGKNNLHRITYNDSLLAQMHNARELLSEIMQVVGLQANFELKEAKVNNVEASVSHRKRYILYNPAFINWISNVTNNKWAAATLLAHEVGHHLNGHTIRRSGSKPKLELEADEFAGFILYRLGASLEEAQEVMKYIAGEKASKTHPARNSRLLAIQKGWSKAANAKESVAAKNLTNY